ncbi:hypothetical protein Taro_026439 [Colocasia esculenta]|uniref:Uncharacterized protein n=1 Tax=Colocasia esculenta TaxID=4460 RepID=A0A843VJJ7_COLES|nr:hypothetical protein [Colocasia esculenta]
MATETEEEVAADAAAADAAEQVVQMGSYGAEVRLVDDPAAEIMLLWAIQQPTLSRPNAFVRHSSLELRLDACGHQLTVLQSPSSMASSRTSIISILGEKVAFFFWWGAGSANLSCCGEEQSRGDGGGDVGQRSRTGQVPGDRRGCGEASSPGKEGRRARLRLWSCWQKNLMFLLRCVAALLGAQVTLTDLPDRLRLLKKNVEVNVKGRDARGSAEVCELTWGDDPDTELIEPLPEFVLGSDVIYSEAAVVDLLFTLRQLSGSHTTIFLAGELRNDVVLEYFLEAALEDFLIGHVDQTQWHPEYRSHRVAVFVLVKKPHKLEE